ncbi:MAG TPA: hypothetical protein VNH80_01660 [Burkholderiales bacterium]|nr:hypothetical protein [Burkholderiales bacterium]
MKTLVATLMLAALAGCGLDAVGGAATGAAIKKQELEQGKKTMEQAQQKIDQAMKLQQQSAEASAEKQ